MCQLVVTIQYFRLSAFNGRHELGLNVDAAAHLAAGGSLRQTADDELHLRVVGIAGVVDVQDTVVLAVLLRLVEDAQQLFKPVVYTAVQQGNLYDDAAVGQALHKGVRHALGHEAVVIVRGMVVDVEHGLLDVAHTVSQQVDGHHGHGMPAVLCHVTRILVLKAQILAETQCLGLHPCLLQLYQHQMLAAVGLAHRGAEVYAEHRQTRALVVDELVGAHLHMHDVLLQQGREDGAGDTVVLHQVFEHHVVDWVCYAYHVALSFELLLQSYNKKGEPPKDSSTFLYYFANDSNDIIRGRFFDSFCGSENHPLIPRVVLRCNDPSAIAIGRLGEYFLESRSVVKQPINHNPSTIRILGGHFKVVRHDFRRI